MSKDFNEYIYIYILNLEKCIIFINYTIIYLSIIQLYIYQLYTIYDISYIYKFHFKNLKALV